MTAVVTQQQADQWRNQIATMAPQFERALPTDVPVQRFIRAAETAIGRDRKLLECDRSTLLQSLMQSAECGLMPNGRDAALVRYKSDVQFIPMIGGILKLMRNTGEVKSIVCETICAKDQFFYRLGDDPKLEHTPDLNDRGAMIGAYAVLLTKDGGSYYEVMGIKEIERIRNCSAGFKYAQSQNKNNSVWHLWPEEMARKTVLRRLAKRCPLSTDRLVELVEADDRDYEPDTAPPPKTAVANLHDALLAGKPQHIDAKPSEDVQDAQFVDAEDDRPQEEVAHPEPAGEPIHDTPEKITTDDPVWEAPENAIAELNGILSRATKIEAIDEYLAGWKDMVGNSFIERVAIATTAQGQKLATTRKLVIQKAAKK